jgi:hypothetical protein
LLVKKEKIEIVINMIVETTTMDGPEGVSKYKELKIPITTDKTASNEDIIAIFSGDFASCLAAAAGIINNEVISSRPTILNETATTIVINSIINS